MITKKTIENEKKIAVLIDPDKQNISEVAKKSKLFQQHGIDYIFVGGSLISVSINEVVNIIKINTNIPVVLFPGSVFQICNQADAILFISLISGRNPELLIGNHVIAAPFLKSSKLQIIPTGYILIDGGTTTSVEYMSNTKPIPANKIDIAIATALAGEYTGSQVIYMDAGSGAINSISPKMISEVKKNISIPLIIGGGIRDKQTLQNICEAGADIVVIGTAIEKDDYIVKEFSEIVHSYKK